MAGMGPPPNPNARRRNTTPSMVKLPASGYDGAIPEWPLGRRTKATVQVWEQLWRTPQAQVWAQLGYTRAVARYVQLLLAAEKSEASAAVLSEVRQMEDRLGLNPLALLRLRWQIDEPGEVVQLRAASGGQRRIRAVEPE